MRLKRKYKVDLWASGYQYYSAYYRLWWWPFWFRCYDGVSGMCTTLEEAEEQALKHSKIKVPKYLDI